LFRKLSNISALLLAPVLIVIAGCGGRVSAFSGESSSAITIQAATSHLDTNRTIRYTATLSNGEPASVKWFVSGGDRSAGAGTISMDGLYTPPSYLTEDAVTVAVSAVAAGTTAPKTATLLVTPGFLQPLTPGNLSLGPNGTVIISGSMAEVGGGGGIRFSLATDAAGTPGGAGSLSSPTCVRGSIGGSNPAYTVCSVTYTAPASVSAAGSVFIVGSVTGAGVESGPAKSWTRVLLNPTGINSNPAAHEAHLALPVLLGSSSGNNSDYDTDLGKLADCCGGTLGALLQDTSGNRYVLSNNHVLARSDQAIPGETIIQPGLIDNGCTPYGFGPGTTPVASLTGYPALRAPATNVDAAIALVSPGAIDFKGSILELGAKQQDGTLAAAPPGISSTSGRGETASLGMMVAKSGRTTGLTCAAVSAVSVDVVVDYYTDCAETAHAMTKTFTNQIVIAGTNFSDAGDSGALVVDSANAEPVGLFFAGGTDANGVEHAIANPIGDVLGALDVQVPGTNGQTTSYSLVGGADHPVSCLSYDTKAAGTNAPAETGTGASLSATERERVEAVLPTAQSMIQLLGQSSARLMPDLDIGAIRVVVAASKDLPGEGVIGIYLEPGARGGSDAFSSLPIPQSIDGVTTMVIPVTGAPAETAVPILAGQPRAASLAQVLAVKQRHAAALMKSNPAVFGVGVGQSLNNPRDAAVMLFVDRKKLTEKLPASIEGQRVRVVLMDRLLVSRSHGQGVRNSNTCLSSRRPASTAFDESDEVGRASDLFDEKLSLPE
jgi:hypothetical protein